MMKYLGKSKYGSVVLGAALGLFIPSILFVTYYLIRYKGMRFSSFLHYLNGGGTFLPILSLCVLPNLLTFFIFIWTKRDKSAKGVLMATFAFAIYVCIMKMLEG